MSSCEWKKGKPRAALTASSNSTVTTRVVLRTARLDSLGAPRPPHHRLRDELSTVEDHVEIVVAIAGFRIVYTNDGRVVVPRRGLLLDDDVAAPLALNDPERHVTLRESDASHVRANIARHVALDVLQHRPVAAPADDRRLVDIPGPVQHADFAHVLVVAGVLDFAVDLTRRRARRPQRREPVAVHAAAVIADSHDRDVIVVRPWLLHDVHVAPTRGHLHGHRAVAVWQLVPHVQITGTAVRGAEECHVCTSH